MKTNLENEIEVNEGSPEEFVDHNDVVNAKKLTLQDIRDHMSGPVVSLMLHIIAITFLSAVIVIKAPEDEGNEIIVPIRKVEQIEIKEIPEPPETVPEDPDVVMDKDPIKPEVADPDVPPVDQINVPNPTPEIILPLIKLNDSSLHIDLPAPTVMSLRDPKRRDDAVDDGATNPRKVKKALLRGLHWLKDHQNPDGSWGDSNQGNVPAYTGLALLAFLGRGETPSSPEFGPTVLKAIKKLMQFSGSDANGVRGGYRHGIVMYALAEAYAMTRIPMLESIVKKGTRRIITGQNANGSFNYGYDNSKMRSDLSVAGWNYQAMKAAFAAECDIEGLIPAMDKAMDVGLKKTHLATSGGFCYGDKGGAKGTMTSVGTLCLQLFGDVKSKEVQRGVAYLEQPNQFWFSWKGQNGKVPGWSLYQWYYQTQVFFQAYDGHKVKWRKWDKLFSRELVKRQKRDGRWESPQYAFGSNKKGHGEGSFKGLDQPVYATSLCCLMLEVYYRYMGTSAVKNLEKIASKKTSDDDLDLGLIMQ